MRFGADFTVVYIAGASRSGSTVIEDYLARRFGGVACGELYRISQFAKGRARIVQEDGAQETCACGTPVSECSFWRAVSDEAGLNLVETAFRSGLSLWQRAVFRLIVRLFGSRMTKWIAKLLPAFRRELEVGENCLLVYQAISRVAKVNLIVDSSKQAHQYYVLKAVAPERIRLITLLRDARAVAASMTKGPRGEVIARKMKARTGRPPAPEDVAGEAFRAWVLSTLNGLLAFAFTNRKRRTLLYYEAFCDDPLEEMRRIERRFSLTEQNHAHEGHAIGGSPSRHTAGFDVIRADTSWKEQSQTRNRSFSAIFARLLNRLLGYEEYSCPRQ